MSSDRRPRITVISALTARTQFGQIMRRAREKNERFVVDRRGEPQVIIMSLKDYIDTIAPAPEWLRAIRAEAKRKGLNTLTMRDIDVEIRAVRWQQHQGKTTKRPLPERDPQRQQCR